MFKKPILFSTLALLCALNYQCQSESALQETAFIQPAFENLSTDYTFRKINNREPQTLEFSSGTTIEIPANVFVDENNVPVEDVTIKYAEFHDAADILISGLPMQYDSAGTNDFQTAGMFDIRAFDAQKKELFLAENKALTVDMGSFVAGNEYNFYQLNEAAENWEFQGTAKPVVNQQKQAAMEALKATKPAYPVTPTAPSNEQPIIDFKVNYTNHPELASMKNVLWEYAGEQALESMQIEWAMEKEVTSVKLNSTEEVGKYKLEVVAGVNQTEIPVKPVLSGENLKEAQAAFEAKMQQYNTDYVAYQTNLAKFDLEADILRSFKVTRLGACNWDTLLQRIRAGFLKLFAADFDFDVPVDLSNLRVMLITGDDRAVIPYAPAQWKKFIIDPNAKNKLVAVLPDDRVATCNSKVFDQIGEQSHFTFKMQVEPEPVASAEALRDLIKSL